MIQQEDLAETDDNSVLQSMVNFNSTIHEKQANNNNNKTNCMRDLTIISVRTFLVVGDREANLNKWIMQLHGIYWPIH